jgi:NADH-quinone oxidoreductase subunit F
MDIHLMQAAPTAAERAAVDALLGPPESRWEGGERAEGDDARLARTGHETRAQRHLLLPALHAVQDACGWISEGALNYIAERLTVPPAEAYGVASFYALFALEPRPGRVVHVCDDVVCAGAGAADLAAALEAEHGPAGEGGPDAAVLWERSPCLGLCERAPAVLLQRAGEGDRAVAPASAAGVGEALGGRAPAEAVPVTEIAPQTSEPGDPGLRLLRRVGRVDPTSLDDYRAHGGYLALRHALDIGPGGVLREISDSKLVGRGGAAFPTAVKWEAVARAPERPHYVICNADESEPGTFKDRVLMEHDPFALVEAMTIAGLATGSEHGFLYLRGEYPLATQRLTAALEQARTRGLLGPDVMGSGHAFDIELRRGAGAYICGEETALMESIEGKRGEPRNKPPFPTQFGLFGKPTAVNNVETLYNVLDVLVEGGPGYAERGTRGSTGTKLFCVSGAVERPGLYEVAFGTTLGELLTLAGGVRQGRALQTVLLGGAAGTFVGPDQLDVPVTFEDARAAGFALGSGAVVVFDGRTDIAGIVRRIAAFFRDESCGQCVPCRVGTVRQEEALHRLDGNGSDPAAEHALLDDLAAVMRDASICGLGQTAASAVQSALRQGLLGGADADAPRPAAPPPGAGGYAGAGPSDNGKGV